MTPRVWPRIIVEHARICAVATVLLTVLLGAGLYRLQFDFRPTTVFLAGNQVSRDLAEFHEQFGPDENDVVVMIEARNAFELSALLRLRQLRDQLRGIKGVSHVASIFDLRQRGSTVLPLFPAEFGPRFDVQKYREAVLNHPIAADQLVSRDGAILLLWIRLDGDAMSVSETVGSVDPIRQFVGQFESDTGMQAWLCGHPAIRVEVLTTLQRSLVLSSVCALLMAGAVALLLFRGILLTLLAVMPPIIGSIWTFGAMSWSGYAVGGLTSALPSLIFVIGMTDSVHLLLHGKRSIASGHDGRRSAYRMLIRVGPACLLTSLTTVISFGSLTLSETESVQEFGFWAATGAGLVLAADIMILPTLLRYTPTRWISEHHRDEGRAVARMIDRLTGPAVRHPRWTGFAAVALTILLLYPAFSQRVDIVWTETIANDSETTIAMARSDEAIGGSLQAFIVVTWPDGKEFTDREVATVTADVQRLLRDAAGFAAPYSVFNVLAGIPGRSLADRYNKFKRAPIEMREKLVSPNHRSLTVSARVPNDGAAALIGRLQHVDQQLQQISRSHPEYRFKITGTAVAAAKNMNAIIRDLARSLTFASVLVFLVLTIAFRSVKLGLLSIIPNALPLLVTASTLSLLGLPLQITSAFTFSMCLGLAVDDTIHMMTRYQSVRRAGRSVDDSVRSSIYDVGPALVITTMILLAGFLAMESSPMPAIQMFASLSCLTLITALIGDLVLLPAMLLWINSDDQLAPNRQT